MVQVQKTCVCTLLLDERESYVEVIVVFFLQADAAVVAAAEGQGRGGSGLLQSGQYLHAAAGL